MMDTIAGHKVRVFDSGPEWADRYTVVLMDQHHYDEHDRMEYDALSVGDDCDSPIGYSMWVTVRLPQLATEARLGFSGLPERVQQHIIERLT
jgi:hypothetical protein